MDPYPATRDRVGTPAPPIRQSEIFWPCSGQGGARRVILTSLSRAHIIPTHPQPYPTKNVENVSSKSSSKLQNFVLLGANFLCTVPMSAPFLCTTFEFFTNVLFWCTVFEFLCFWDWIFLPTLLDFFKPATFLVSYFAILEFTCFLVICLLILEFFYKREKRLWTFNRLCSLLLFSRIDSFVAPN